MPSLCCWPQAASGLHIDYRSLKAIARSPTKYRCIQPVCLSPLSALVPSPAPPLSANPVHWPSQTCSPAGRPQAPV